METKVRFGIFPKLLTFSLCISLAPLGVIGFSAYRDMQALGSKLVSEGTGHLEDLGASIIENKAKDVARQLEIYIATHPNATARDLQSDPVFGDLAVQPVGKTGYTAVQDAATAVNLFHKNPKIVNMDLHKLEAKLPEFWNIMEASLGGNESSGYYNWTDPDGSVRSKFMYIAPVGSETADGVLMGVAATTYVDEFSMPMRQLEEGVGSVMRQKLFLFYILLGGTVLVVMVASLLLAGNISRPILYLAKVADEISTGNLARKIDISRRDEIGILINSTKRMQRSLILATKKLREKQSRHSKIAQRP